MARRIEVDETLPPVAVPVRILNELCQHALETLPEECCGLIIGTDLIRYREFVRCRNEMTARHRADPAEFPRDGRSAFYMNEHDYLRVRERAEAAVERVTAVYHSHVGAGAYLSELDLAYSESELFPFPDADQIVVPVFGRNVGPVAVFRRVASGFGGHLIKPDES